MMTLMGSRGQQWLFGHVPNVLKLVAPVGLAAGRYLAGIYSGSERQQRYDGLCSSLGSAKEAPN